MTVKENQPGLYADLELRFRRQAGPAHDLRQTVQNSKGHGRLETCTLLASTDLNSYLDWPGLKQCLCVERRVIRLTTGEISTERVYGLTSLAPDQLDLR